MLSGGFRPTENPTHLLVATLVFIGAMLLYIVLHELVHGAAYKLLTGERLTFGLSWSCAFCGVPEIYTYRKTAIIALVSPLIVFTLIFSALSAALYFTSHLFYLYSTILFGIHLGGCSGDIYVTWLLSVRFKDARTLIRDTGPEQYIYLPDEEKCD